MMSDIVYLNGNLVPRDEARISPFDYGFLYGYGVFETMRSYNGTVFRLDRHLTRLERSANILGFSTGSPDFAKAVNNTLYANGLKDARIRIAVSIGEGAMVPDISSCTQPTVIITATPYQPYPQSMYDRGFTAMISSIRRNSGSPLTGAKSACFAENLLAKREAKSHGVDEAICLNDKGNLTEASTSNLFLVKDNQLYTPSIESGILPGITREAVLEIAAQSGIYYAESALAPDDLLYTDEAFVTNSVIEVMPLTSVSGNQIGNGRPGVMTGAIASAYRELVKKETTSI
jgi:branched-chain amino acid aminotransferase